MRKKAMKSYIDVRVEMYLEITFIVLLGVYVERLPFEKKNSLPHTPFVLPYAASSLYVRVYNQEK